MDWTKKKKILILAVVAILVGVILFCAIGVPLICINHYCFDIKYIAETKTIEILYTGLNNEIDLFLSCRSIDDIGVVHGYISAAESEVTLKRNVPYYIQIATTDISYEITISLDNGKRPSKTLYSAYYTDNFLRESWQKLLPELDPYSKYNS